MNYLLVNHNCVLHTSSESKERNTRGKTKYKLKYVFHLVSKCLKLLTLNGVELHVNLTFMSFGKVFSPMKKMTLSNKIAELHKQGLPQHIAAKGKNSCKNVSKIPRGLQQKTRAAELKKKNTPFSEGFCGVSIKTKADLLPKLKPPMILLAVQ